MSNCLKKIIGEELIGPSGRPNVNKMKFIGFKENDKVNLYNEILGRTKFLSDDSKFSERLYCIIHDIYKVQHCRYCKTKKLRYYNFSKGYANSCKKCSQKFKLDQKRKIEGELHTYELIHINILKKGISQYLFNGDGKLKKGRLCKSGFYSHKLYNEYGSILHHTKFLSADCTLSERLYCINNDIKEPILCKWCKTNNVQYSNINIGYHEYCSTSCGCKGSDEKRVKTNVERFNVERPFQNKYIIEKTRREWLLNNNGSFPQGSIEAKEKRSQTKLEKYGDPCYNNLEQVMKTKYKKYGNPFYTNKEQIIKTNNENLGVDGPLQNDKILKRTQETLFENGGVYHGLCSSDILLKTHRNNFKIISKPQRKLYGLILQLFEDSILEHFVGGKFIDIAIPSEMVAVEYDGSYGHKNRKELDRKRQKHLESLGGKFIRYVDYIPSKEEFLKDIRMVENGN